MKKKILIFGIVLIIIVVLVVLGLFLFVGENTGISIQTTTSKNNNEKIEHKELNKDNEEMEYKEIEYKEIKEVFEGGYAILTKESAKSNEAPVYYFADKTGKIIGEKSISDYISPWSYMNGYIIKEPGHEDDSYIMDHTGNTVLQSTSSSSTSHAAYGKVSKNGYVVMVRKEDGLSGEVLKTTIEDMNGNVIYSINGRAKYDWICEDIFYVGDSDINGNGLIDEEDEEYKLVYDVVNAKTGKTQKIKLGQFDSGVRTVAYNSYFSINNYIITSDLEKIYDNLPSMTKGLNDKYYLSSYGITDFTGNIVFNFEEGGFKDVYYHDGTYYVVSNTDFLYTMNDSFEKISEPIKFESTLVNTTEGIVTMLNNSTVKLNKDLTYTEIFSDGRLEPKSSNEVYDNFVYFMKNDKNIYSGPVYWAYDLKENKVITFHK